MNSTKNLKLPPGPKGSFPFGCAIEFRDDPTGFLLRTAKEYPNISRFRFAHLPMVLLSDPEHIKHVLQTNNKNYLKGIEYEHLKPILGEGLLTSEGDFWLRQRRLAQPAFHRDRIASFANKMIDCTKEMLEEWKKFPAEKSFDLHKEMMALALDIVGRTLLSTYVKDNASSVEHSLSIAIEESYRRINALVNFPLWLPVPRHMKYNRARRDLDEVVLGIIEERRKGKTKEDDLLDMLMEAVDEDDGAKMTNRQLRDEIMTIFLAGHETTANALTWTFCLLSQNHEVQKKFKEEIHSVLNGRTPAMEDLRNLPYTTQIIHESLRLYPPAWALGRTALADDVINEVKIKKGDNVIISPFVVHRDPELWKNPDEFIPERFTPEKMKDLHKFAYFPFGGGPRFCIGNNFAMIEMQIILAMVGQACDLKLEEDFKVEVDPLITLRPKNGMRINLKI
jgi:cytochrome P450